MDFVLLGFIIYLFVILGVGLWTYKMNKTHEDFLIAGRKLNPWVVAFSERASGESAWLILGLPGAAFAVGLIEIWTAIGCLLGIAFSWLFIAYRLRKFSEEKGSLTVPEFLGDEGGKEGDYIRIISTFIILFFFIFYISAQFNGAGKVLNVTFGIPHTTGVIIGAIIIIFYTLMGGFFAVAWTDFFQGILMITTLVLLPILGIIYLMHSGIAFTDLFNHYPEHFHIFSGKSGWQVFVGIIGGLSWGLGYMGQPHLVTRFMSIRSADEIKKSTIIAISWAIPAFFGAVLIGLIGLAIYGSGYFADPEKVMPTLALKLLPPWLAGILISGAIAAMMSTADSQLLVATSAVSEDFYHRILKKDVSHEKLLWISRITTIALGLFAFILAIVSKTLIFKIVGYAWSGLGASFGPPLLLSLWWKKLNGKGILAGLLTGTIVTIVWSSIPTLNDFLTVRFVAFVLSFIITMGVSIITKKKEKD